MNKGFTLIELLVVVMIIGILSSIALPQYTTAVERSRAAEALTLLGAVSDAAQRFYFQHDVWPIEQANPWGSLDIDVPSFGSGRGGKYFDLQWNKCGSKFCISATRRDLTDSNGKYMLKVILTDNADSDTVTSTRCCGTYNNANIASCGTLTANSKAEKFCNAITGTHNSDF